MPNSIAYIKNHITVLDVVYKRTVCSTVLNSRWRMIRAGRNGAITYESETKTFGYDRNMPSQLV